MVVSNKQFVLEKLICCVIVLFFIVLLSPLHVMHAFVVLGHAHFALSYWYQYKAGKVKKVYILPFILAAIFFLYLALTFSVWFALFVVTFFLFHNFFDEFKLNGYSVSIEYFGVAVMFVSFLTGWSIDFFLQENMTPYALIVGGTITILLYGVKAIMSGIQWPWKSVYMWFLLLMLCLFAGLEFFGLRPDARSAIGGIILLHYFSWYVRFGFRFYETDKAVFNNYILRVFIANTIFIAGYFIVVVALEKNSIFYPLVYRPFGFYAWTLLHLITTFRFGDYKAAFNFSKI